MLKIVLKRFNATVQQNFVHKSITVSKKMFFRCLKIINGKGVHYFEIILNTIKTS